MLRNRIRELRKAKGRTLDQVAEACGTSNQQLSRLEREERPLYHEMMRRIAAALEVKVSELLPDEDVEWRLAADEARIVEIMRTLQERDREQLLRVVEAGYASAPANQEAQRDDQEDRPAA